jgi:16S rRNA (uracil1498-N3)-methyltransferase
MNLLLLHEDDFENPERVVVRGRRFEHICKVLKSAPDDRLRVGVLGGGCGHGTLVSLTSEAASLNVMLDEAPPLASRIELVIGLPRPKSLLRIINHATQLGIKRIDFTHSYRVEKSYWHCDQLNPKKIRAAWIKGLEQAADTIPPEIVFHRRLKPFVEDELPALTENKSKIVAHPYSKHENRKTPGEKIVLALGPEGGFIDYEIGMLTQLGFEAQKFGEHILALENALPFIVGTLT